MWTARVRYESPWNPWTRKIAALGSFALILVALVVMNMGESQPALTGAMLGDVPSPASSPGALAAHDIPLERDNADSVAQALLVALVGEGDEGASFVQQDIAARTGCFAQYRAASIETAGSATAFRRDVGRAHRRWDRADSFVGEAREEDPAGRSVGLIAVIRCP